MAERSNPTPAKWLLVVLLAWAGVLALRAASVGGEWHPLSAYTRALIVGWLLLYVVGFVAALAPAGGTVEKKRFPPQKWFVKWTRRLSLVAAFGAAAIIYEFAVLRGYGFATDVTLIRITEVSNSKDGFSGSGISGMGRLMTPALVPAWLIALLSIEKLGKMTWLVLITATLIVFYQQATFEGGRFFTASLLLCGLLAFQLRGSIEERARAKAPRKKRGFMRKLTIPVILIIAVLSFGQVFLDRVATTYPNLAEAYATFATNLDIDVSTDTLRKLDNDSAFWFVVYMFWIYVTHAINEFDVLVHYDRLVHAFGVVEFPQISKALSVFTGMDLSYDLSENHPVPGVYTTFLGPSYMDFGAPILLVTGLALGFLTALSLRRLYRGQFSGFGLAAPLFVALGIFSPIHSLVLNLWPAIFWAWIAALASQRRPQTTSRMGAPTLVMHIDREPRHG